MIFHFHSISDLESQSYLDMRFNGTPQQNPRSLSDPMWSDIPATQWPIPPVPRAVISNCGDESY